MENGLCKQGDRGGDCCSDLGEMTVACITVEATDLESRETEYVYWREDWWSLLDEGWEMRERKESKVPAQYLVGAQ